MLQTPRVIHGMMHAREMIGTTRSRVSFFMNRFRKHGFIEYNGRIRVHKSLLNVILLDQPAGRSASSAALLNASQAKAKAKVKARAKTSPTTATRRRSGQN